jgi:hypothetical protein
MDSNFPKKYKKTPLKIGFYEIYTDTRKEILGT